MNRESKKTKKSKNKYSAGDNIGIPNAENNNEINVKDDTVVCADVYDTGSNPSKRDRGAKRDSRPTAKRKTSSLVAEGTVHSETAISNADVYRNRIKRLQVDALNAEKQLTEYPPTPPESCLETAKRALSLPPDSAEATNLILSILSSKARKPLLEMVRNLNLEEAGTLIDKILDMSSSTGKLRGCANTSNTVFVLRSFLLRHSPTCLFDHQRVEHLLDCWKHLRERQEMQKSLLCLRGRADYVFSMYQRNTQHSTTAEKTASIVNS